jgi:hypothetical protein
VLSWTFVVAVAQLLSPATVDLVLAGVLAGLLHPCADCLICQSNGPHGFLLKTSGASCGA